MILRRVPRHLEEATIQNLPHLLNAGDCLVLNDTRVAPCKIRCRVSASASGVGRAPSAGVSDAGRIGEKPAEILIVRRVEISTRDWEIDAMVFPGRAFKKGAVVKIGGTVEGQVLSVSDIGRHIALRAGPGGPDIRDSLRAVGQIPFPPYITNPSIPPDRYQTCFARAEGSVAAPTAGLHFTPELLGRLAEARIRTAFVTLHVGPGTFRPVTQREESSGRLHPEPYWVGEEAARLIRRAKSEGGRIIAVGTTACRTLETVAAKFGRIQADAGTTDLFIREGFVFHAVDGLLTNFHLPRTSLLRLVCSLAGRDFLLESYREAIRRKFRFYSFGDAMLIL